MAEVSHDHHHPIEEHPERHEHRDAQIRPLVWIVIVFVIAALIWQLGLIWVFRVFEAQTQRGQMRNTAIERGQVETPEPRLQGIPRYHPNGPAQDSKAMREENQKKLSSYGRGIDANTARIPVDRAMELALQRNLFPTTQKGGADAK
jgi:hypothetical protein